MVTKEVLLSLIRLGIRHELAQSSGFLVQGSCQIDWTAVKDLAEMQGLSAVVIDGIERLKSLNIQAVQWVQLPPRKFLLEWIGETMQDYEYRYEQYCQSIGELAGFYNEHGFRMMVLKGYACSLNWPMPSHRPCGDIDIWLFGHCKEADAVLEAERPTRVVHGEEEFKVDKSHFHHTVFWWGDFMVENHFEMVNTLVSRSNARIEQLFKQLAMDDNYTNEVCGEKIWLPSPNFHALFLLRHSILHFTYEWFNIRQILDWAFFIEKHTKEIDWAWLHSVLKEYGMQDFFNCLNAICVEDLGFDAALFHGVSCNPELKERMLNDALFSYSVEQESANVFHRLLFKYRRYKERKWKHNMCYKESMYSHMLSSLWLHITHPNML